MFADAKTALRRHLRRLRQNLHPRERQRATRRSNRLLYPLIKRGRRIGVYWAVGSELSLADFIRTAHRRGAQVYLPYIERGRQRLWFTPYRPGQAQERAQKRNPAIPQFAGTRIRAHGLQVLVMPLVGVDGQGRRLGQGGGFYDVTLAHTRGRLQPRRVGAGFACQQVDALPSEPHDMPLNAFVSEAGYARFTMTEGQE
ncbi:5-formyltetrahydrofolate cyclo-ligase [Neisseria sp. HSC-16F19]|nr:5-formyltetrahydrofolate cyclo-ligase [Neisseria sp. HSC-16F19]